MNRDQFITALWRDLDVRLSALEASRKPAPASPPPAPGLSKEAILRIADERDLKLNSVEMLSPRGAVILELADALERAEDEIKNRKAGQQTMTAHRHDLEAQIDKLERERDALTLKLAEAETELARMKAAYERELHEAEQTLGRALGYPRYVDDQVNFPGATEADGVCTGEHAVATLALEAAGRIKSLYDALDAAVRERVRLREKAFGEANEMEDKLNKAEAELAALGPVEWEGGSPDKGWRCVFARKEYAIEWQQGSYSSNNTEPVRLIRAIRRVKECQ